MLAGMPGSHQHSAVRAERIHSIKLAISSPLPRNHLTSPHPNPEASGRAGRGVGFHPQEGLDPLGPLAYFYRKGDTGRLDIVSSAEA